MNTIWFLAGLLVGFLVGVGATLFYIRWRMKQQLGNLEEQMGQVMDMTEGLDDMVPDEEEPAEGTPEEDREE